MSENKKLFIKVIFIIGFAFLLLSNAKSQIYYSELTEENYYKILSGNWFFPATIELTDNSTHECFIARYPDSDRIRVKPIEDTTRIVVMTHKYVKSFTYNICGINARHVYVDIDYRKNKTKMRPVEVLDTGRINIYVYRWVETPEISHIPFSKKTYFQLYEQFYLEKDGNIFPMDDFGKDIREFIDDNDEIYIPFKKEKIYKNDAYEPYLLVIKLYNIYDRNKE